MIRLALAAFALASGAAAGAREPAGLHRALAALAAQGKFSGAVVIRGAEGVRFARGYGLADPFAGRAFTPGTPVDSASLAKPVTAAAILSLAAAGRLALDRPARTYLPAFPFAGITVRQLLSHSTGLTLDSSPAGLAGMPNARLIAKMGERPLLFRPGTAFAYCNACAIALAEIVERVSGQPYLAFARAHLSLPAGVSLRPARLADWTGRAIGYRTGADGRPERFDSWEGELFYGPANLSLSAIDLAEWGSRWWRGPLARLRPAAVAPARIGGAVSGLTLGNFYCAPGKRRCHYLGHHEGFHHLLYWDSDRRVAIAMVSNNALSPTVQQRLQRALVAFAEGKAAVAGRELGAELPSRTAVAGSYRLPGGERIDLAPGEAAPLMVTRRGLDYPAYPVGSAIHYVPGLDAYLAAAPGGGLRWLTLYDDVVAARLPPERRR